MPTYNARVIPNSSIPNGYIREHCSAHHSQIAIIGQNKGQQVRIERCTPDRVTLLDLSLYTVIAVHDDEPDVVFVGFRDPESTHHDLREEGGGAFDRWHITSTDISEESFPKLKTVIGRHFEYAVAFHGWTENSICIGGSTPPDLKNQTKMAINAIADFDVCVKTDEEGCPDGFNGNDPKNIVNRLGGLWLGDSQLGREELCSAQRKIEKNHPILYEEVQYVH